MKQSAPFTVVGTDLRTKDDRTKKLRFKVAALDFGGKLSIYRKLQHHGFVHVFPQALSRLRSMPSSQMQYFSLMAPVTLARWITRTPR